MNSELIRLLEQETGDKLTAKQVAVAVTSLSDAAQVWEQVRSFAFDSGWLCLTDKVCPLYSGQDLADITNGIILSAELAGQTQSLHIRQSENGWTATIITVGSGESCLMLEESYLSTETKQQGRGRLQYQVFWKSSEGVCKPFVARLAGLVKGGNN
jgi:hypothetical protein